MLRGLLDAAQLDPIAILRKHAKSDHTFRILLVHSHMVAAKALAIATRASIEVDLPFVAQATLLHDIGIVATHAPDLGCTGSAPYIMHGVLGREILEGEGLLRHALVCERHTGLGITKEDIRRQGLPLPERDLCPVTPEEHLICLADKFFSKNPQALTQEKSLTEVRAEADRFGPANRQALEALLRHFDVL